MVKLRNKGSYEVGFPYINLCLVLLKQSKGARDKMWEDFMRTELYLGSNKDPLQIAWWVSKYMKRMEPRKVEVQMLSEEQKVMSMDDFKELIGGLSAPLVKE